MLKLCSTGIRNYSVFESEQRVAPVRIAGERMPSIGFGASPSVHLPGEIPKGCLPYASRQPRHRGDDQRHEHQTLARRQHPHGRPWWGARNEE
jgi:hypothetical protein